MTLKASLINLLFPNSCPGCGAFQQPGIRLCPACEEAVLLSQNHYCHTCGKVRCFCHYRTVHYDRVIACTCYTKLRGHPADRAVRALKNGRNPNIADFAAQVIAGRLGGSMEYGSFDLVTAVPMHPARLRQRGYNQAARFGKGVAAWLSLPYQPDILSKRFSRHSQHQLDARARAEYIAAFSVRSCELTGRRILLCDDVLTTGTTLDCCAELLKRCGAANVTAAVIATTTRLSVIEPELRSIMFPAEN